MKGLSFTTGMTFFTPLLVFAQQPESITDVVNILNPIIDTLARIGITLIILFIVWGAVEYVRDDGGSGKDAGKQKMLWGIIGLFIVVGIWGIIRVLQNTVFF